MTQALFAAALTLAALFLMDRIAPLSVRAAGVGLMPWTDRAAVTVFNRSYGWLRFPRTLFICLTSLVVFIGRLITDHETAVTIWIMIFCGLWGAFSWRDIWQARAEACLGVGEANHE